jgi:hypothetical protein
MMKKVKISLEAFYGASWLLAFVSMLGGQPLIKVNIGMNSETRWIVESSNWK